jgi:hypothetical protein
MPLLARAKGRVAAQLGSAATAGDAAQSWLCAISAAAVLVSIVANAALGWWWLDPIAGLGIAGLAVHEGREAWAGKVCGDCAPIGFESAQSCGEETPGRVAGGWPASADDLQANGHCEAGLAGGIACYCLQLVAPYAQRLVLYAAGEVKMVGAGEVCVGEAAGVHKARAAP